MEKTFKNNPGNNITANGETVLENTTFKKPYIRPYAQIIDFEDVVVCSGGCTTKCYGTGIVDLAPNENEEIIDKEYFNVGE